ncbi:MAG: LCP family protein [Parcubacteria group bacterium]|jgi:LCP family protein required for cell wall assembly
MKNFQSERLAHKKKFYKKRWFKLSLFVIIIIVAVGGFFAWKTGYIMNKISGSGNSALGSLLSGSKALSGDNGRTNILLLGMRGASDPHGGLLADSIMVASFDTKNNKVGLISVPRDLYVQIPGTNERGKINSVYSYWQSGGRAQGMEKMEEMMGTITGLKIDHAVVINFDGFKQLIDTVGGVDVRILKPFTEPKQFVEGNECGGVFSLPAGTNRLNGDKALCYARARETTNDFDRSKRQQVILKALKDKLVTLGTLADFGKLNNILTIIGNNVKTNLTPDEMKGFYDQFISLKEADIVQRVFENSEKGLLKVPGTGGVGYVLVPIAGQDNYSQMQTACRDIFTQQ